MIRGGAVTCPAGSAYSDLDSSADVTESSGDGPGREKKDTADEAEKRNDDFLLHQEESGSQDRDDTDDVGHAVVDQSDDDQVVDREENAVGRGHNEGGGRQGGKHHETKRCEQLYGAPSQGLKKTLHL